MCRESETLLILRKKEPKTQMCSFLTLLILPEVPVHLPLFRWDETTRTYVLFRCVPVLCLSMLTCFWLLLSGFMWWGHCVLWSCSEFRHVLTSSLHVVPTQSIWTTQVYVSYRCISDESFLLYWERKWIRLHAVAVSKPSKVTQTLIKSMAHYLSDLGETII